MESVEAYYNNLTYSGWSYGSSWVVLGCLGRFSVCRKILASVKIYTKYSTPSLRSNFPKQVFGHLIAFFVENRNLQNTEIFE